MKPLRYTKLIASLCFVRFYILISGFSFEITRRNLIENIIVITTFSTNDRSSNELPIWLRDYTKLAPLGSKSKTSSKTYNLSLERLAERLEHDLLLGSTEVFKNSYQFTGDVSTDIFRDDCTFVDPTNRVSSLNQYQNALRVLFDPDTSSIEIVDPLTVSEKEREIRGKVRVRGFLQFPWKPFVKSYESSIVYKVDENGLIYEQAQSWSKSATEALKESFTPTIFTPPPSSFLVPSSPNDEPREVTKLFTFLNGRRPTEYSLEERVEIDELINKIANYPSFTGQLSPSELINGKWILAYLQPGPTGATIDRRIPFFPEFSFNDNYQIFSSNDASIKNIGEVIGPLLSIQVIGNYNAVSGGNQGRQRFLAQIKEGKICLAQGQSNCFGFPISGEGLFDSVYVGERLRIGQNLNGGGARVVQIRLE